MTQRHMLAFSTTLAGPGQPCIGHTRLRPEHARHEWLSQRRPAALVIDQRIVRRQSHQQSRIPEPVGGY